MKRLYLLRHAKSSWKALDLDDHERPLSRRGRRAAGAMGRHLAALGVNPDLVLCSSARRAAETFAWIRPHLSAKLEFRMVPDLYAASAEGVTGIIRSVPSEVDDLVLLGHEPALSEVAATVAVLDDSQPWRRMRQKFSTGACAEIHVSITCWQELACGCGRLIRFSRPRDLK